MRQETACPCATSSMQANAIVATLPQLLTTVST